MAFCNIVCLYDNMHCFFSVINSSHSLDNSRCAIFVQLPVFGIDRFVMHLFVVALFNGVEVVEGAARPFLH